MLGVSVVLTILFVYLEIKAYRDAAPLVLKSKLAIRNYMYRWIAHGGRAVVFSHDLSWVDDPEMKALLSAKAGRNEPAYAYQR